MIFLVLLIFNLKRVSQVRETRQVKKTILASKDLSSKFYNTLKGLTEIVS